MSVLRSIESRLARIVEGAFGRAFRSNVQPAELARRLTRAMDDHQQPTLRNVYVPSAYEVYLSPDDSRQLRAAQAALATELAEFLAEHARREGYALAARPHVVFHDDTDLEVGAFGIAVDTDDLAAAAAEQAAAAEAPAAEGEPAASRTMVWTPPAQPVVPATAGGDHLTIFAPDGPVPVTGARVTIGRGKSNDVVLHDSSVSREHAEVVPRGGGWVLRDLDSTNGVVANGTKVREHELKAGDKVVFGNVSVRVDRLPEDELPS
jgi:hypothetical protein